MTLFAGNPKTKSRANLNRPYMEGSKQAGVPKPLPSCDSRTQKKDCLLGS